MSKLFPVVCYSIYVHYLNFDQSTSNKVETPQVKSEHFERLDLPDLYDILAEQTVRFNKMLLQKSSKEQMSFLKSSIKELQQEIQRRKESGL